ncbi:BGTF surface domain-containing protein [Halobacterium zhouii]|uniref:DUF7827 domain-containing protein n=1 Tax=Halobacterium zhouii TaxID=2902624 RepID=UPI0022B7BEB0|nr:BGTF surface domain-containing protein [Halobacterium zhouii]
MTENTSKFRAVFLTALMVFSVFAGTIAFTGGAAADASNLTVTNGPVAPGGSVNFDVTNSSANDNGSIHVWVDADGNGVYNSGETNVSNSATADGATWSGSITAPSSEGEYTLAAAEASSLTAGTTSAEVNATFSVDGTAPTLRKATHYVDSDNGSIVELAYTGDVVENGTASAEIGLTDGTTVPVSDVEFSGNGRVVVNTSTVHNNIQNISVSGIEDTAGNAVSGDDFAVTFAASTVNTTANAESFTGYSGSLIALEGTVGDTFEITGPSTDLTRGTGANSQVYVLNTNDFEAGDYNITNGDSEVTLELSDLGLEIAADDTSITTTDALTATVTADTIDRDLTAELLNAEGEVVDTQDAQIDSDGSAAIDFGEVAAGNYTVQVTDDNTGVTATTSTVVVTTASDATAGFADSQITVDRGDIATLNVSLTNANEATVLLGSEGVNYEANVTVTDENGDGYVVLKFNTYASGDTQRGAAFSVGSGDDLTVNSESNLSEPLADGTYDISVRNGLTGSADALGSITLTKRSTGSMTTWTAPGSTSADKVLSGTLAEESTIAKGDYVVQRVSATGIYGLIAEKGNFTQALDNGLELEINQTKASTGPNQDPKVVDISASVANNSFYFVTNETTDTVSIVAQPESFVFEGDATGPVAGDVYTATFKVTTESGLVSANETASAQFSVVKATTSITYEGDVVSLANSKNATITGESSLAPGTSFMVRVQSQQTSGEPFIFRDETVVVQEDGTWTASFDATEAALNSTFSITVSQGTSTVAGTSVSGVTGEVVKSTTDNPTTDNPTTDDSTSTTDDSTSTTDDSTSTTSAPSTTDNEDDGTSSDGSSSGSTPGFGIGVALVAVLGAALLALRE